MDFMGCGSPGAGVRPSLDGGTFFQDIPSKPGSTRVGRLLSHCFHSPTHHPHLSLSITQKENGKLAAIFSNSSWEM